MAPELLVDVLIIGGGPSGLSAAHTLSRALFSTAVFDSEKYQNEEPRPLHIIPTLENEDLAIYEREVRKRLLSQFKNLFFIDCKVLSVTRRDNGDFAIFESSRRLWRGKKLLLATGVEYVAPDIEGYTDCWATRIFPNVFHHGYENRGSRSAGVLAFGRTAEFAASANSIARNTLRYAEKVTIYTNGWEAGVETLKALLFNKDIKVDPKPIRSLVKGPSGAEVAINFKDGGYVVEKFLIHNPQTRLWLPFVEPLNLERTVQITGETLRVDKYNETNVRGCFAAGDIVSGSESALDAVASGAYAAKIITSALQAD